MKNLLGSVLMLALCAWWAWCGYVLRKIAEKERSVKNKIEIIEKIKQGDFTPDEFDYIASGDKELMQLKSNFYNNKVKK